MNCLLILNGWCWLIDILQVKYLNNIIEQDHRFIKKLTKQQKGFNSFSSATATPKGIEVAHMIRKQQFDNSNSTTQANPHFSNLRHSLDNCAQRTPAFRPTLNFATEPLQLCEMRQIVQRTVLCQSQTPVLSRQCGAYSASRLGCPV